MKNFSKSTWLMIIAALITIIGLATGKYLFIFLALPLGFNIFGKGKDQD